MTLALPVAWAVLGALVGVGVRWSSVRLARLEELEPGFERWKAAGPAILCAVLFAGLAVAVGPHWTVLLVRSLWIAILVHVIFFDLEFRLILDRVLLPSVVAALILSVSFGHPSIRQSVAAGIAAGLLFLLVYLLGALVMRQEAMGFGDVKLVAFIGTILGVTNTSVLSPIFSALFYGVLLAGLLSVILIVLRRKRVRDTIAYGPYLAAGALIVLFQLGPN